jgi:hypothetical protein
MLVGAAFVWVAGCKRMVGPVENGVRFDVVEIDETYHLFNDVKQPRCQVQIRYEYPDSATVSLLPVLQNRFVEMMFGETFRDTPPDQILREYAMQYINDFKRFEKRAKHRRALVEDVEPPLVDAEGYAHYIRLRDSVVYNRNGFLSFLVETVDYSGGTYRSRCVYAYVLSLATGEFLQEEDFSGLHYRQNLSRLIVRKIAAANELADVGELEQLGFIALADIGPNGNFVIDDGGITYYFNENEIAGLREGIIRVFIPYEEIGRYVSEESPLALFFK